MTQTSITFSSLVCQSVIETLAERAPQRIDEFRMSPGAKPVQIAHASDVLYVPDLRMQVFENRIVPAEAIYDSWTLSNEIRKGFWGHGKEYERAFICTYSTDEVCILSNFYSRNFFHWVAEELVKAAILERSGYQGRYVMANLPAFAIETMVMMGVTPERMIYALDGPTIFRSVVYTAAIRENLIEYPEIFRAMRATLVAAAGACAPNRSRRLWLDRDAGVSRPGDLVNKDEVYPILARHGFEVIDMAKLPIREQIATAHRANVLSGPHGAGFVHNLFMEPKSTVIECFSPAFINPCNLEICRVMNHRYFMIVPNNAHGLYTHGQQIKLDCMHLELVLESLG